MRRADLSARDEHETDFRVQLLVCFYLLGCRYTLGAVYSVNCYKCIHPNFNLVSFDTVCLSWFCIETDGDRPSHVVFNPLFALPMAIAHIFNAAIQFSGYVHNKRKSSPPSKTLYLHFAN